MKKIIKLILILAAIGLLALVGIYIVRISINMLGEYKGASGGEPDPMFDIIEPEPTPDISSPEESADGQEFTDRSSEWEDTAITPIYNSD